MRATARGLEVRASAIAKLDARTVASGVSAWIHGRITGRDVNLRDPIQLLGHHLQRAVTENA